MKILGIENLQRDEGQIFYIRRYNGNAQIQLPTNIESTPISFTIEMDCFGNRTINLEISNQINYPVIPLKKSLTEYILTEDKEGRLPC